MSIDPNKLDQAREWARDNLDEGHFLHGDRVMAAAEIIAALPDTIVDGDKLREALDWIDSKPSGDDYDAEFYDRLRALLPAPTPRTLADIPWDDDEHLYMEAVTVSGRRYIMLAPMGKTAVSDNTILAAERGGGLPVCVPAEFLTPAGRYARMVWPDEHHPATDTEDTPEPEQARPEDVPAGEPWIVEYEGREWIGCRNDPRTQLPWLVIGRDYHGFDYCYDEEVTLVSRLVPEVKA